MAPRIHREGGVRPILGADEFVCHVNPSTFPFETCTAFFFSRESIIFFLVGV
jgi:hypothetical protein